MGDKSSPSVTSWSEFEARAATDLDALPEAVRAIVEEYRAEQAAAAAATKPTLAEDGRELPYTCRMYESIPGEEELLQLQWMRLDMSDMDSDETWAQPSNQAEDYDCGPDSGLLLPSVYRVDPGQLFPLTFVGLPPELLRTKEANEGFPRGTAERSEDELCKLGRRLTSWLSGSDRGQAGDALEGILHTVAYLSPGDWDACLERHVDLGKCDPDAFLDLTSSCPLPTLHCMLHTVLPSFVSRSQSSGTDNTSADGGRSLRETRGASAVRALCRKAGILSASQKQDPVRFRDVLSASGLRNLGRLGREAEITLAEAFFEASHQA